MFADLAQRIVAAFAPFASLVEEAMRAAAVSDQCPLCGGTGDRPGAEHDDLPPEGEPDPGACPLCDGRGRVPRALTVAPSE